MYDNFYIKINKYFLINIFVLDNLMKEYNSIKIKEYLETQKKNYKIFIKSSISINTLIIICLIIINIIFFVYFCKNNTKNLINIKTFNKSNIVSPEYNIKDSSYNFEKKPKISIIIPYFDSLIENNDLKILMINSILNQTLDDIEILLSFNQINNNLFFKTKELSNLSAHIKYFKSESDIYNDTKKLILESNGKFISVFNNYIKIKDINLFERIYFNTYGKINHIYEFYIENKKNYLIKTKIIKDIYDKDLFFKKFIFLIKYIKLI